MSSIFYFYQASLWQFLCKIPAHPNWYLLIIQPIPQPYLGANVAQPETPGRDIQLPLPGISLNSTAMSFFRGLGEYLDDFQPFFNQFDIW